MRDLASEVQTALEARALVARDFIWIVARDRDTGDPVNDGMWSDVGTITCDILDPDTGSADERTFYGSGTLIEISTINLTSTLTVQPVTVKMSQVVSRVETLVRTYDVKQARVEIFRGLFDTATRELVAPAVCRFVGFVNSLEIKTPSENDEGHVLLECVSHTQELFRSNPDTRSDASQRLRSGTDNFFQDVATIGEQEFFWGKTNGPLPASVQQAIAWRKYLEANYKG